MRFKKLFAGVSAACVLGALLAVPALPAEAAMDNNCGLSITQPVTDATYAYSTSLVSCSTYMDYTAVEVRNTIQEEVAFVWTSRNTKYNYSSGATSLSVTSKYNCNGHGTDVYRGTGSGKTSDNGSSSSTGSTRSLTC
jgi:hypothetical protein